MIAAVDIFDEVEADVTALNGEIVRRAFHGHCCQFVHNKKEFAWLLRRYCDYRMQLHRCHVQEEMCWKGRNSYTERLPDEHYAIKRTLKFEAARLRDQLKKIWPCAACIWLYNPTYRLRRFPQLTC